MTWIIFRTGASAKDTATRFNEQLAFFNARKGLPNASAKTTAYAQPVPHPTNGDIAFPVLDEDQALISLAPKPFDIVAEKQLIAEGFWPATPLSLRTVPTQVQPLMATQAAPETMVRAFLSRHGWRIAAVVAAGAALAAGLVHYFG